MPRNILLVTKGHTFDYNAFYAIFDENPAATTTKVEQPAAEVILRPENVDAYDAVVFYDMCGTRPDASGERPQPGDDYKRSIEALLESGKGLVMLNHALVQWPAWPRWREISATPFMYGEGMLNGVPTPGSGYRGGAGEPDRNATHVLSVATKGHPATEGLGDGFEIVDELYIKTADFENDPDLIPLLRSDYDFVQENFKLASINAEERARWQHPRGSNLIAWAKRTGNSPIVAMECGDGPAAFANADFRRFLWSSIEWVASDDAKAWARKPARAAQ